MREYVGWELRFERIMFSVTIGEVKVFTSLDITAGRDPTSLGRAPRESVDEFHRTRSGLTGRVSAGPWTSSTRTCSDFGAGRRRGLAAELERDSGIYPWA